jgi:beta-galactosidase GanA
MNNDCCCERCRRRSHHYLEKKYGSIEALNNHR